MHGVKQRNCTIAVSIAAAIVFFAAFAPWGQIRQGRISNFPIGNNMFASANISHTMTGWNGRLTLGPLEIPNWLVVVAAVATTVVAWLRTLSIWNAHTAFTLVLAVYGMVHTSFSILTLSPARNASVGFGSLLTAAALIAMLVALVKEARAAARTTTHQAPQAHSETAAHR